MVHRRTAPRFADRVHMACARELERLEFTHTSGRCFVWSATAPLLGWLGLNHGIKRDGSVDITPFVGVHASELARFVAERRGERYRPGAFATFGFPLTLVPGAPKISAANAVFSFFPDIEIGPTARKLAVSLQRVALPFYRRMRSMSDVIRVLRVTSDLQGAGAQDLTAALWVAGRKAAALKMADTVVKRMPAMDSIMREYLQGFFGPFLEYAATESPKHQDRRTGRARKRAARQV
jgi:hypothetical protein